jgi:hypothetical protein
MQLREEEEGPGERILSAFSLCKQDLDKGSSSLQHLSLRCLDYFSYSLKLDLVFISVTILILPAAALFQVLLNPPHVTAFIIVVSTPR